MTEPTYWNGEPCNARRVLAMVGTVPVPTWWCNGMEGTVRRAVEIRYRGSKPFYLDDEDGSGWRKVTQGRGLPSWGHRSLPVSEVAEGSLQ